VASASTVDDAAAAMQLVDYRDQSAIVQIPTATVRRRTRRGREARRNVIAICADLSESVRMEAFKNTFPTRYVEIGVAEQLIVAMAAVSPRPARSRSSPATRCSTRPLVGASPHHHGAQRQQRQDRRRARRDLGRPDGATHQAVEDIAIMRVLPHMTVVVPCDSIQTKAATLAVAARFGPTYLRFGRAESAVITTADTPFELGRAQTFRDGGDVAIVACGILVYNALLAAAHLAEHDRIECRVVNNHTIKPMDEAAVVAAAAACGAVVTVEEHQVHGGMGSRVFARSWPRSTRCRSSSSACRTASGNPGRRSSWCVNTDERRGDRRRRAPRHHGSAAAR